MIKNLDLDLDNLEREKSLVKGKSFFPSLLKQVAFYRTSLDSNCLSNSIITISKQIKITFYRLLEMKTELLLWGADIILLTLFHDCVASLLQLDHVASLLQLDHVSGFGRTNWCQSSLLTFSHMSVHNWF